MSNITLFKFEGHQVNTTLVDGKVYFKAKDVATFLGFKDTINAIKQHCKSPVDIDVEVGGVSPPTSQDGNRLEKSKASYLRAAKFINQSDLFRLVLRSKLPKAVEFSDWVVEEVIPTIAETGAYGNKKELTEMDMARNYLASLERVEALKLEAKENQPKIEVYDILASGEGQQTFTSFSKALGLKRKDVIRTLLAKEYVFRNKTGNLEAYAKYVHKGYFIVKIGESDSGHGYATTLITSAGCIHLTEVVFTEKPSDVDKKLASFRIL